MQPGYYGAEAGYKAMFPKTRKGKKAGKTKATRKKKATKLPSQSGKDAATSPNLPTATSCDVCGPDPSDVWDTHMPLPIPEDSPILVLDSEPILVLDSDEE